MTTALATTHTTMNLDDLQRVAKMLAMSGYFDAKGATEQAVAQLATKILAGQEMGYGPFASVQGIHVIQGKPAMSANLMAAAVKASARYDYRVRQMDDAAVSIEFFERIGGKLESLGVSMFTKEDAQKAGTQNMQKFGRNMMYARAVSNGVKWYCPDVFSGNAMYTPEEMEAPVNGDGEIIETTYTVTQPAPAPTPAPAPQASNGNAPEDAASAIIATWNQPSDAYQWSIDIGACHAQNHARNAFEKVIRESFGGKLTKVNAAQVYRAFYDDRLRAAAELKAAEPDISQPADVSDVTAEEGAALWA